MLAIISSSTRVLDAQVSTKDGALVCRPDITLDGNTNIAQDKTLRGRESVQVCT